MVIQVIPKEKRSCKTEKSGVTVILNMLSQDIKSKTADMLTEITMAKNLNVKGILEKHCNGTPIEYCIIPVRSVLL